MARGWESKSVESQQEAAEARKAERPPLSDIEQQILALEHTRKHVLDEIEASRNPRFRELKAKALAFVDGQIAALRGGSPTR
jgi:hypothetical protein